MEPMYAIEIVNLYMDALKSIKEGTFNKDIHAYRLLLQGLGKGHVYDQGFFNDRTVYKIEDVRRMENAKKGERDHQWPSGDRQKAGTISPCR